MNAHSESQPALTKNQDLVYTALSDAEGPLSAYAILDDLRSVRDAIERVDDPITAGDATRMLERIGAQVGYLQVACCTAARMPLYNDVLNGLATTQIHVATSVGQAH